MTQPTLCIAGAEVLTDAWASGAAVRDLWVAGERILALTAPDEPVPESWRAPTVTRIDARGRLAIPGLIDAHCHSYAALLHGTVPGAPLDLFVLEAMSRRAPRDAHGHRVSALLHAVELLRRGVTAHVDHFRDGALPTVEAAEATLAACRDLGVRMTLAPMYEDRVYTESLPIDTARLPAPVRSRWAAMTKPAPEAYFDLMDALLPWRGAHGRLDVMLGVDGPQRCSARLLEMTGRYAERHAMGLHTHLLEARTQLMVAPADAGHSLVAVLDRHGLVGPRTSFAHFVWCTERDIALTAERGASVVHNPLSNLHLGSGLQPTARLLEHGIPLALGTDSASCAAPSVLGAAKLMCLTSRVRGEPESRWLRERNAFDAATVGGARVLGRARELGVLAGGALADIVLIDTRNLDWLPRGDVFAHLVMYETGRNVTDVFVAGRPVLRDGRVQSVDEAALMEEACALAAAEAPAAAASMAVAAEEREHFAPLIEAALAGPLGIDAERFARLR